MRLTAILLFISLSAGAQGIKGINLSDKVKDYVTISTMGGLYGRIASDTLYNGQIYLVSFYPDSLVHPNEAVYMQKSIEAFYDIEFYLYGEGYNEIEYVALKKGVKYFYSIKYVNGFADFKFYMYDIKGMKYKIKENKLGLSKNQVSDF